MIFFLCIIYSLSESSRLFKSSMILSGLLRSTSSTLIEPASKSRNCSSSKLWNMIKQCKFRPSFFTLGGLSSVVSVVLDVSAISVEVVGFDVLVWTPLSSFLIFIKSGLRVDKSRSMSSHFMEWNVGYLRLVSAMRSHSINSSFFEEDEDEDEEE